jgi:hypothetical protein
MAFTTTTQKDNQRFSDRAAVLFIGTAGAATNTITVPWGFQCEFIIGLPSSASAGFTQADNTVTVTGLTDTHDYHLLLIGKGTT